MSTPGREVLAHAAVALARYAKSSSLDGQSVPPELLQVAELLSDAVRNRQAETFLDQWTGDGDNRAMAIAVLTRAEAGEVLRISERSVDRLITAGKLNAVKIGGATRIRRSDIEVYLCSLSSASFRDQLSQKESSL